ncbi:hypothetical protein WME91_11825 [Sorangium sp. So ce269]
MGLLEDAVAEHAVITGPVNRLVDERLVAVDGAGSRLIGRTSSA